MGLDGEVLATPLTKRLEGREEPRKGEEGLPKPDIIDVLPLELVECLDTDDECLPLPEEVELPLAKVDEVEDLLLEIEDLRRAVRPWSGQLPHPSFSSRTRYLACKWGSQLRFTYLYRLCGLYIYA